MAQTSYMERDSDEDDEEMLDGVAEWQYLGSEDEEAGTSAIRARDSGGRRRQSKSGGAGRASSGGGDSGIWGQSLRQASTDSEAEGGDDDDAESE